MRSLKVVQSNACLGWSIQRWTNSVGRWLLKNLVVLGVFGKHRSLVWSVTWVLLISEWKYLSTVLLIGWLERWLLEWDLHGSHIAWIASWLQDTWDASDLQDLVIVFNFWWTVWYLYLFLNLNQIWFEISYLWPRLDRWDWWNYILHSKFKYKFNYYKEKFEARISENYPQLHL